MAFYSSLEVQDCRRVGKKLCVSRSCYQGQGNENRNRVIPILNDGQPIMLSKMNARTNIESQTDYVGRFSAIRKKFLLLLYCFAVLPRQLQNPIHVCVCGRGGIVVCVQRVATTKQQRPTLQQCLCWFGWRVRGPTPIL